MHCPHTRLRLTALTLGLAALLAGCGGGDALPPGASPLIPAPDTTAPTVTIVSGAAGSTATGAVTFTFTFSENVGTTFNADDVVVAGGSKGTFAMPSGTSATLVVTPNAGTSGSLNASVAAGRFSDLAGNLNTAVAAASQAYNTVAGALGSGSTGSCTTAPCVDFGTAGLAMVPFGGMAAEVAADPGDAANKTIKLVKVPAAEVWAGATVDPSGTGVGKVTAFGFGTSKVVTLRFLSPAAGETIMLKVESAIDDKVAMEAQATTTQANQWETLTFDFTTPSSGSFDATKTYDRVSIFPHYNTKVTADTTYYADELKYTAAGGGGGGAGGATSGSTGTCTASPCVDFGGAGLAMVPFGALGAEIAADPSDAANKVAKLVKVPASEVWAGATIDPAGDTARKVVAFGFATSKTVTLRFRAPAAGEVIMLKAESAADPNVLVEAQAITTLANQWETLTFNFAAPTAGGIDPTKVYDRVSIFPHYNTKVSADTTYYADELKYTAAAAGGGGGGGGVACGSSEPTCAPTGSVPADAVVIYSDAAQVANFEPKPDWGQAPPVTYSQVNIAGNNSLKYGFTAPALYEGLDWSASPVNVSAKGKLHIDFWSANVSSVKVSIISTDGGPKESAVTQAVTAGNWNSVDIDLSQFPLPDKTKITQIKLEPNVGGTLFVDNIYFWGTPSVPVGGSNTPNPSALPGSAGAVALPVLATGIYDGFAAAGDGLFAGDYIGKLDSNRNRAGWETATTNGLASNGNVGYFQDAALSASPQKLEENGWVAGVTDNPGGVPSIFRYVIVTAPASTFTNSFMGLFVNAPNNGTVNVSSYGAIKFRVWGPAEMYQEASFSPTLEIKLAGPKVAGCTSTGSGATEIRRTFVANQKIGAASTYKLPLTGWSVVGVCGSDTDGTAVASVLSKLAQVVVVVPGSSFNFSKQNVGGTVVTYATGVNLGPIAFTAN